MNFDEAQKLKANYKPKLIEDGITYHVYVTPNTHDDLIKYFTEIRGFFRNLTDEDARRYSTNNQFSLHGICYNRPDILYKKLL